MATARQKEIIEHSIALIARRGIQELTIRNIAHEIGISDPAIYRHFASKTDILLGVLDLLEQETVGRRRQTGQAEGGGNDELVSHFQALFERLSSAPELSAVIFADEFFLNEELLVRRVRLLMDRTQAEVELLVEREQSAGKLRSDVLPEELATMLIGAVRLLVRRWHIGGHTFSLKDEGLKLITAFMTLADPDL